MSSDGGSGSARNPSKKWLLLCKVYEKALSNWETLLTQSVPDKELFRKAFRAALAKHPEAIESASSGGMLQYIMKKEFPTLQQEAPASIEVLIKDVVTGFRTAARAEFDDFLSDLDLESKLLDLEARESSMREGENGKIVVNLPEPLVLQPEDEMRAVSVESLLAYETQLTLELEKVRPLAIRAPSRRIL